MIRIVSSSRNKNDNNNKIQNPNDMFMSTSLILIDHMGRGPTSGF